MILPIRYALLGFAGLFALLASVALSSDPHDVAGIEASYDPVPTLHMAVPTEPFVR